MSTLEGAKLQAATYPTDVRLQLQAAYACHEAGELKDAVEYYDRSYVLGLPIDGKLRFYFGYGSALRAVGRLDDSEEILRKASREYSYDKALPVHLALTLHRQGKDDEAIAELLELLVRLRDQVKDFAQHKAEILAYAGELRGKPVEVEDKPATRVVAPLPPPKPQAQAPAPAPRPQPAASAGAPGAPAARPPAAAPAAAPAPAKPQPKPAG